MASNKGLGKGLGALLGDFSEEPVSDSAYRLLPIYKVEPNPDQPRHDFDEEELEALSDVCARYHLPLFLSNICFLHVPIPYSRSIKQCNQDSSAEYEEQGIYLQAY